jgi:hypothetical protein
MSSWVGDIEETREQTHRSRFLWPIALTIPGVMLVGLYALIRQPADIGGGLALLAGYVIGGIGIVLLGVHAFRGRR